jgi:N-acetyl-S-(2-succino)cysteine monooxygenase
MGNANRQMKLGLFIRPCGHHIASWRHPNAHADAGSNFQRFVEMAKTAEAGLLDMLFSADTNSAWTAEGHAMNRQHYVAWIEPYTLLSALSGFTRNIGLACTASTSFDQPFSTARRFASLDLVSGGRGAWNVVTSGNETEAQNFSQDKHLPKTERYKRAREYVQVVKGLWDSWDEDSFPRDRESGVFFKWDKMHTLDHNGEYFRVRGPLNVPRSPQGQPVIIQAGASEEGRELAAETAEVIFAASAELSKAQEFYKDVKGRMARFGREPDDVKILPGMSVFVAPTLQEAKDKHDYLQSLIHPDVGLGLLSRRIGYDVTKLPPDEPLPELPKNDTIGSRSDMMVEIARRDKLTLRQLYQLFATARGHFSLVGTPKMVVDAMEEWFVNGGCDGFNVLCPTFPDGLNDFVSLVIPELQRRGLFRTRYEGTTLRENLGLERPPSRYAGAAA